VWLFPKYPKSQVSSQAIIMRSKVFLNISAYPIESTKWLEKIID
jgi:hypothetical protein